MATDSGDESGCCLLRTSYSITCPVRRSAVLLENEELARHVAHHVQQMLWQEQVAEVVTVDLYTPGSTKIRSMKPSFDISTETIRDWLSVVLVHSRRSAATCFFFTVVGT